MIIFCYCRGGSSIKQKVGISPLTSVFNWFLSGTWEVRELGAPVGNSICRRASIWFGKAVTVGRSGVTHEVYIWAFAWAIVVMRFWCCCNVASAVVASQALWLHVGIAPVVWWGYSRSRILRPEPLIVWVFYLLSKSIILIPRPLPLNSLMSLRTE